MKRGRKCDGRGTIQCAVIGSKTRLTKFRLQEALRSTDSTTKISAIFVNAIQHGGWRTYSGPTEFTPEGIATANVACDSRGFGKNNAWLAPSVTASPFLLNDAGLKRKSLPAATATQTQRNAILYRERRRE